MGGETMSDLMEKLVTVMVVVVVTLLVQRIVVRAARGALEHAKVPSASIFINVLRAFIWVCALLAVLRPVFGIEPTAFIAALGVVSVAISLGLQDTISNIIGGLGLLLGHVLEPGDFVDVGGVRGRVCDVSWRSTTLTDCAGNIEVIPNSVLNKTSLTKLTASNFATSTLDLIIRVDADFSAVAQEIMSVTTTVLGDKLDPLQGSKVRYTGMVSGGVALKIFFCLRENQSSIDAADEIMKALSGKYWLAGAEKNASEQKMKKAVL